MPKNKSVQRLTTVNGQPVGRRYAKIADAAVYIDANPDHGAADDHRRQNQGLPLQPAAGSGRPQRD
jgi:hypothetical protein